MDWIGLWVPAIYVQPNARGPAIAVLDSFHLVLVIFSPSSEVRGSEDDYDSLMCGLLGYIFACPCGPRFKAVFTLTQRLRDPDAPSYSVLVVWYTGSGILQGIKNDILHLIWKPICVGRKIGAKKEELPFLILYNVKRHLPFWSFSQSEVYRRKLHAVEKVVEIVENMWWRYGSLCCFKCAEICIEAMAGNFQELMWY
jgi:hypothetical protein